MNFRIAELFRSQPESTRPWEEHANALVDWILRSQAATPDDGVAESFYLPSNAWNASYPETTGYIVCSMLRAADFGLGNPAQIRSSVRKMGVWLTQTQLADGAFPGGPVSITNPQPAVFNTGQILKGLTDLIRQGFDSDEMLQQSSRRAAAWMIDEQDADGAWRRGLSVLATAPVRAYNVRAAWGLARYGLALDDQDAIQSGIRNAEWLMRMRESDGWFNHMNFNDGEDPLTHTVAYTIRGLLEVGAACGRDDFVDAAAEAAEKMKRLQASNGAIPGTIAKGYRPACSWTNTTGLAQMAIIWFRLAEITGEKSWSDAAALANRFNRRLHCLSSHNDGFRGALQGSYPGHLGYGRFWYMNWTQKFFLDSLLAEMGVSIV